MRFHPLALRPSDPQVAHQLDDLSESRVVVEGPARQVCQVAPSNTNTIATAALVGLGFDRTMGCLVADPR